MIDTKELRRLKETSDAFLNEFKVKGSRCHVDYLQALLNAIDELLDAHDERDAWRRRFDAMASLYRVEHGEYMDESDIEMIIDEARATP